MNSRILQVITLVILIINFDLSLANENEKVDEEQIRITREHSNDAITRNDINSIVSFLDSEYQVTTGSGKFIHGRDLMGAAFKEAFNKFKDVSYVRTPKEVAISKHNSLASEIGSWVGTWTNLKGSVHMGGTYSASWHKVDNSWKIRSELFVTLYCEGTGC